MHYFDGTSSPALRRAPLPNAIAKTPTRKSPSEYLDDVIKICGTLRYAADKIEDSAREADEARKKGRGWELNPAKGQLDTIAATLDRLRTIFAEAQG
jgi:hypothetical protein